MKNFRTYKFSRLLLFGLGLFICLTVNLTTLSSIKATNKQVFSNSLTPQQAATYYWQGKINSAIAGWENLLQNSTDSEAATLHGYLGIAYRDIGQLGASVRHFREAINFYKNQDKRSSHLGQTLIELAKTYNELGQWKQSQPLLKEAIEKAETDKNLLLKNLAYRSLCTAYWLEGNFDLAIESCEISRNLASILGQQEELVAALNDLTNVLLSRSKHYLEQAKAVEAEGQVNEQQRLEFLASTDRQGAVLATTKAVQLSQRQISLSAVRALINLNELRGDGSIRAQAILDKLPPSRSKAELLTLLAQQIPSDKARATFKEAIATAETVGALKTQAFALMRLGIWYEKLGQYSQALETSEQGLWIAQRIGASESLYQLQWLHGRVYRTLKRKNEAIQAYRGAIATLQQLRSDIASASPQWQLNVRQEVEPVYRELLSLLLEKNRNRPKILKNSLDIFQQLQFSQLQSFFGDACLELRQASLDSQVSFPNQAAIIHTIILADSTYTILELPNGGIYAYPIAIKSAQLEKEIKDWRQQLENRRIPLGSLDLSERLYSLLVRPMESQLAQANPEELIFINDGLLRNIPPAALYDGKQFLIEKYPISLSLGISSPSVDSSTVERGASIFGLSVPVIDKALNSEFPPLPNVPTETLQVQKIVGGDRFLDKNFTWANFEAQMQKDYPIVHLATHGEFGGTLESTFLLAYDRKISLSKLEEFLAQRQMPINLLTLSACQTASGSENAILGLAGVALRSGVKNVLASLWAIEDKATSELIADFYRHLKKGMSKAKALQSAQITQLDKGSYITQWGAFVAIGN